MSSFPKKTLWSFLCLLALVRAAGAASFVDPGFVSEHVVSLSPYSPVGLAFGPEGRIYIWEKQGVVRVFKNGALLPAPFIDISAQVNLANDRGLLGLALHPDFASNGYVYLLYTYEHAGTPNNTGARTARLTRVQADPANLDVALPGTETVLLGSIGTPSCDAYPLGSDCIPSEALSHTIGTVRFAPDGRMFVSIGDGARYGAIDSRALRSQLLDSFAGKILRINEDGTAPGDNPFDDGTNSIRSKVWAYGLRNPYRFALHPTLGEPFIGDVGWDDWEEINHGRGANFGWPCYEGEGPQPLYNPYYIECAQLPPSAVTAPAFAYAHTLGRAAVAGTFYTGDTYPAKYADNLFVADYSIGWIRRMVLDSTGDPLSIEVFATGVGTPVSIERGPDGLLYYVDFSTGQIRRIRYQGPSAQATAAPTSGFSPLSVSFSSAGSSDGGNGPLTYLWDFGDEATSTQANPVHDYTASATVTYLARLTVTDTNGFSSSDTQQITINSTAPVATITQPANGQHVRPGDTVVFQGSGTDAEDGPLPATSLSWTILLRHDDHLHTYASATGTGGSFPVANHGQGDYAHEVRLTVTDSSGLTNTQTVVLPVDPPSNTPPAVAITSPLEDASILTPSSVVIDVAATDPEGSVAQVYFYVGNVLLGTDTTSPYGFTWPNVPPGNYSLTARATDNQGAVGISAAVNVSVRSSLPSPWASQDIGGPGVAGIAGYDGSTFTVKGSGSDIWNAADRFHYVYQSLNGDGEVVTRMLSQEATNAWAKAGLMIRESLASNSRHASMFITPANGTAFQRRVATGAMSEGTSSTGAIPIWLKLVRSGSLFTGYSSPDGVKWSQVGAVSIPMPSAVTIGLAVTSHKNTALCTVTMDNVSIDLGTSNTPPTVVMTNPVSGASFTAPASITLRADASDADGTVARVDFYSGVTLLASDPAADPYTFHWTDVPAGSYSLSARAIDDDGAEGQSASVAITVSPPGTPPTVSLTSPASGATFNAPATITVAANASDSDGTVARVDFYSGSTLLGTDPDAPYSFDWLDVPAGSYSLSARATDNDGSQSSSSAVPITVSPPGVPPTVALTSPTSGATFDAPATITLEGDASDSDGTVVRVDFYAGATLIGTDTEAPYSANWTGVAAGSYSLTATATDDGGATATSSAVAITVNATFPSPWSSQDVGSPALAGNAMYSSGAFTITAAGNDIWNGSDQFHYVWQPLSGDGEIVARVASQQNTNGWAKAGVMIRESVAANSANVAMLITPGNGATFQNRPSTGATSTSVSGGPGSAPRWVRLARNGASLTGYTSADGFNWSPVGTVTLAMGANVTIGLAATSHRASTLGTSVLDNVSLVAGVPNAPPTVGITSPANGATFSAPATVNIQATAGDSDGTIDRVEFYAGSNLLGTDTSGPWEFSWVDPPGGGHSLTARAVDNRGAVTVSSAVGITVSNNPLPSPWVNSDVGAVGVAGTASYSLGRFTVAGSGADIWKSADGFHFVYRTLTGDGAILTRVVSQQNTNGWAKAGVMIRENLTPGSRNVMMLITPANGVNFQYRSAAGAASTSVPGGAAAVPYWVRIRRSGATLTGDASADGVNWLPIGSITMSLPPTVYIGLAVTSHNNSALSTTGFEDVAVTGSQ